MAAAKKAKRAPVKGATFFSIFGVPEAAIAEQFIREGRATRISKKETRAAGAPTKNNMGHKLMFSLSIKNVDVEEYNARVASFKMRAEAFTPHNNIKRFFHCRKCLDEKPIDQSPRDWAQLEVGFTIAGIQVWCKRHECNVCHVDFQGYKHPALLTTVEDDQGNTH